MAWLAAFLANFVKDMIPSIIEAIGNSIKKYQTWNDERLASNQYDKKVTEALTVYKQAKTPQEQDDAFKNLIASARNH